MENNGSSSVSLASTRSVSGSRIFRLIEELERVGCLRRMRS